MSRRHRILVRAARAMISDGAIVSFLVLALIADADVWRESEDWRWPLGCLALQLAAAAVIAVSGEYWTSASKERSCTDAEFGTAGTKRAPTRAA